MNPGAAAGPPRDLPARVARFAVAHPGTVLLAVAVLCILGLVSALEVPIDAVPDITNVQVAVLTRAGGFGPVEVEELVTHPVEIGLAGIPGLREMRSTSRAGISSVTVVFEEGTDPLLARLQVSQRLPGISADMPASAEMPELGPFTTGLGEVYHFTVRWPGHSTIETHTLVDWELVHPLRMVPGVVEANVWGGDIRQYQVVLDPARMTARGVTLTMVHEALARSNHSVGAGAIERSGTGVVVRGEGLLQTPDEIGRVVVRGASPGVGAAAVHVRDVGDVQIGAGLRQGVATGDGRGELVYVMVQMLAGGNARTVVRDVKERLAELSRQMPPGVQIEPFYDRAEFVDRVLTTVGHNLLEGAALVIAVLLFALGDLFAGLLVASLIPLSALIGAVIVRYAGLSGNLMSLGAVDFGLLVDGAVVVVEHTMVAARLRRDEDTHAVAAAAASEVGRPVAFGVAIIALVYVPVLTLQGVEGRMFRPMAIVVLGALSAALALSLTLVPALAPVLVRRVRRRRAATRADDDDAGEPRFVRWTRRGYRPVLDLVMAHPRVAVLVVLALVGVAGVLAARRGGEFMPRLNEGSFAIQLTRPPATSLEEGARGTTVVEQTLARFPEVARVVSRTGSPAVATDLMGPEESDVFVMLRPPEGWRAPYDREALVNQMDEALHRALPGTEFSFTQPIEMRMAELLSGIRSDVGVRVYGEDLETLRQLGDEVARVMRTTRGGEDVRAEQVDGLPTLVVRPERDALARYGLHSDDVLEYVQALRAGVPDGRVFEGERRFDLMLRVRGGERARAQDILDLPVPLPPMVQLVAQAPLDAPVIADPASGAMQSVHPSGGTSVALAQVARVRDEFGPARVSHEYGRRRLTVEGNVRGRDLASYVSEVQARLSRLRFPRGYTYTVSGEYQNLARAARRLAIIVPLVLLAILVMLRASLGRWSAAGLVFVNVPVAASGGVIALALRDMPLSITAGVGFIALAGIAVLNGLVLGTEIDHLRGRGLAQRDAAREGALSRLRPVLTTATVAALGFVPMALAKGTGAEVQRPLATVIIGGLLTSTAATLLLMPALSQGRRRRGSPSTAPAPGAPGTGEPAATGPVADGA